ncbi:hypothetical protein [Streptomyces macrosporus]|uniref:Uncharacterized protein n=1 Tax=Streptomyces macrosporus TaxID=44032 RepID=A0ABN3K506_9ACTN
MSGGEGGLSGGVRLVGSVYRYDNGLGVRVADVVPYEPAAASRRGRLPFGGT